MWWFKMNLWNDSCKVTVNEIKGCKKLLKESRYFIWRTNWLHQLWSWRGLKILLHTLKTVENGLVRLFSCRKISYCQWNYCLLELTKTQFFDKIEFSQVVNEEGGKNKVEINYCNSCRNIIIFLYAQNIFFWVFLMFLKTSKTLRSLCIFLCKQICDLNGYYLLFWIVYDE